MMKVSGTGGASGAGRTRGASTPRLPGGSFKVEGAGAASPAPGSAGAAEVASASALGALIALQSEGRGSAKNRAQAERMLMLLERLRDGLLSGRMSTSDLSALVDAADAKLHDPDNELAALYAEIGLRARVELAKFGR